MLACLSSLSCVTPKGHRVTSKGQSHSLTLQGHLCSLGIERGCNKRTRQQSFSQNSVCDRIRNTSRTNDRNKCRCGCSYRWSKQDFYRFVDQDFQSTGRSILVEENHKEAESNQPLRLSYQGNHWRLQVLDGQIELSASLDGDINWAA
ncbi:hypothetical protein PoB_007099600 [Plakobranchus ocellatus]|uniref:Uncharacterized protein n=1 Tax=Plakobranchus ocellatus TaxID=259542 RepID=A0AAV4DKU3_9GAST|nr:hypothetical protein PoB_007099600 [Plakobranchus ocellatus]